MKKLNLILLALFSLVSLNINAHDFEVVNSDGKTIYYNITSSTDLTLSVTYRGNSLGSYSNEYEGAITIPSSVSYNGKTYSVTSIDNYAFYSCDGLTSVTIPNSVTEIGSSAFSGCSGLTSVTIPNSVTEIGSFAFEDCSGLKELTIPNSVTSIGNNAFYKCSKLTSVTIPNSVTSIRYAAFSSCSGLTSVTIPNSVTSIGNQAFWDCDGLTSVTIPNSVTSIGNQAFFDCSGLTSITIPNSVTSIGRSAFYGCSGLTSITIPNSVTSIGNAAFRDCYGLTEIYSLSSEPAVCDVLPFWGVDKTIPVYIPYGSMSAYKSASEWEDFKNFIESEFTGVEEEEISASDIKVISGNGIEINDYYGRIRIVNLAGQVVKDAYVNCSIQISLPKGIYIVVTENSSQKVIL